MAYFAKLAGDNKITAVLAVHNNELLDENGQESEQKGRDFLHKLLGPNDTWIQTSYNTEAGIHKLGGTPLRKNYAQVNGTYDRAKDAFIPPQDFPSWIFNENTCRWDPPVARPDDGKVYDWNEDTTSWKERTIPAT
tara:strand:+ start:569 stop:976 length:408 start_codon:yes stop_codon:yes gene_type:complete